MKFQENYTTSKILNKEKDEVITISDDAYAIIEAINKLCNIINGKF